MEIQGILSGTFRIFLQRYFSKVSSRSFSSRVSILPSRCSRPFQLFRIFWMRWTVWEIGGKFWISIRISREISWGGRYTFIAFFELRIVKEREGWYKIYWDRSILGYLLLPRSYSKFRPWENFSKNLCTIYVRYGIFEFFIV